MRYYGYIKHKFFDKNGLEINVKETKPMPLNSDIEFNEMKTIVINLVKHKQIHKQEQFKYCVFDTVKQIELEVRKYSNLDGMGIWSFPDLIVELKSGDNISTPFLSYKKESVSKIVDIDKFLIEYNKNYMTFSNLMEYDDAEWALTKIITLSETEVYKTFKELKPSLFPVTKSGIIRLDTKLASNNWSSNIESCEFYQGDLLLNIYVQNLSTDRNDIINGYDFFASKGNYKYFDDSRLELYHNVANADIHDYVFEAVYNPTDKLHVLQAILLASLYKTKDITQLPKLKDVVNYILNK